jgi:hypothetical protein
MINLRKPSKTFNMDQETKRLMARMPVAARGDMRAHLVDAQLASEVVVKSRAERDSAAATTK